MKNRVLARALTHTESENSQYLAPCHFYQPEELKKSLEKSGLEVLEMVGLEGLASGHQKEANRLAKKYPRAWKIWWETHLKTCTQETSVGISEHFMAICNKP